jgi:LysM repeat protein
MNNGPATFEYNIQPDDTLWDLADEYNTSVEDIMAANNNPNTLYVGQVIYIPNNEPIEASQRGPGRGPGGGPGRGPGRGPGPGREFDRGREFRRRPEEFGRRPYAYPYEPYNPYYPCSPYDPNCPYYQY